MHHQNLYGRKNQKLKKVVTSHVDESTREQEENSIRSKNLIFLQEGEEVPEIIKTFYLIQPSEITSSKF
jgi:hypothetical protein